MHTSRQTQYYAAFQYLVLFQVLKYYLQQSALALLCRVDLELVKQDLQFKHSQFPTHLASELVGELAR